MPKQLWPLITVLFFLCSCTRSAKTESPPTTTEPTSAAAVSPEEISALEVEKKAVPDIQERFRRRKLSRDKRIKSVNKTDCKFETLGKWQNFLKFQDSGKISVINGEVEEWGISSISLSQIGKIIKGPCSGGEVLFATYNDEEPNKTGPEPNYLLADGFLTEETQSNISNEDYSDELKVVIVKVGNHYITASSDQKLLDFLMDFAGNVYAYQDPKIEYRNLFIPSDEILAKGKKIKIVAESFYWLRPEGRLQNDAIKLFEDPSVGKLYNHIKSSEMNWPDGLWSDVSIGVEQSRPEYWFDDFLDSSKFESLKSSKLIPSAIDPDWLEPDPENESALKGPYENYLKRVESLVERTQEINDAKVGNIPFSLEKLTFDEYRKKKPFLFIKDSLGRTQIHRRSLHEIPLLAEPLIYIYGRPGLKVDLKLCANLVHKLSWPAYGNGWKVQLLENGILWDLNNLKKVGSLFWEGFAGPIPPLKHGWVLRPSEIPSFLEQTLPQYGLNKKETADFKKYWAAVLTQAPYYRIEIIPSDWIDVICPLSISPKPGHLLRVYLRAYPKEEFEVVPAPPLPASRAPRPDFTVVEWGGVLE